MQLDGHYTGVVAGDCLWVGGGIIDKLHHFFSVSWVILDCSAAIVFSVNSISGLTVCEYYNFF